LEETVREVLAQHAGLVLDAMTLDPHADLFGAGMTSHASVNVMLGLEDALDIEFPDSLLKKSTFTSIVSIMEAVDSLSPVLS
jgi:acyl carrier protein